ncbi:hypothetical protein [Nocardioides sp. AE5]|uniref:hypothetical protein n=1 Tax=Nocardioides sp. AE5 TaxID=2962573 RepID=UPI002882759C|nr:hypothetical protein [Nocardioides sp. AE5]MDT0203917.1 hypothetical protein [Nocardioides sp. AE5]
MIADQVGEHRVECHHRDRQDQHDPEQASELARVVGVPGVAAVFVVLAVALVRRGAMFVIPRGVPKVSATSLMAGMMARLIRTVFVLIIAMRTHTMKVYPPWVYFHQAPLRTGSPTRSRRRQKGPQGLAEILSRHEGCADHYYDI